jgi:DNA-dependent protein kinase catalytic subunit
LNGGNPAYITVTELKESIHSSETYIKPLVTIVLGDSAFNARAKVKEQCANTKEQVDCLIDQATDPNILARTYSGWAPWI